MNYIYSDSEIVPIVAMVTSNNSSNFTLFEKVFLT